jgi:hypothetical protein
MVRLFYISVVVSLLSLQSHGGEPHSVGLENMAKTLRGDVRLISMGDSYCAPYFSRVPLAGLRVWPIPNITALGGGAAVNCHLIDCIKNCNPVALIQSSDSFGYTVERNTTNEFFGLPLRGIREIYTDDSFGITDPKSNRLFEFKIDYAGKSYLSDGVHGVFNENGDEIAIRLLYRCPSDISLQLEELAIFDNFQNVGTVQLRDGARKFWHLNEDPTFGTRQAVAKQINASGIDFPATNDSANLLRVYLEQTTLLVGTNKYFAPAGCMYYHRDENSQRKSGFYFNHLSDDSWSYSGFGSNEECEGTHDKVFSTQQFTHWLDVTTLDRNQPTVFMWYLAPESLNYSTALARMENMVNQANDAAALVGLTDFQHFIVISHLFNMSSDDEQARVYFENQQNAAFDLASSTANVSSASIFAATDEMLFTGSSASPWLLYKGFDTFTFGSNEINLVDFSNGDLLDSGNVHPKNEESAAFFAAILGNIIRDAGCLADVSLDGYINSTDLLAVIGNIGAAYVEEDINQDGIVDIQDLLLVVDGWGECWPVQAPFNTSGFRTK